MSPYPSPLPVNRRGAGCGNCARSRARGGGNCRHHGGGSTGPRTPAGKATAAENAVRHGAWRDPERVLAGLSEEGRGAFEALVGAVCEEEGVGSRLDRGLVRSFVTAEILEDDARAWLLRRGLVEERAEEDGGEPRPRVQQGVLDALERLARLKQRVHERLRAGTGGRGDAGGRPYAELVEALRAAREEDLDQDADAPGVGVDAAAAGAAEAGEGGPDGGAGE